MKKVLTLILLTLSLASCSWVKATKEIKVFNKDNLINTKGSFYLIYPKNGFHESTFTGKLKANPHSATEVVATLRNGLSKRLGELTISESNTSIEQGFKDAKTKGSQYLIDITINEWRDAPSVLCSEHTLDTVDLTVFVYSVETKKLINKQKIENKGCPVVFFNFIPIGTISPEGRLSEMLQKWLDNIS